MSESPTPEPQAPDSATAVAVAEPPAPAPEVPAATAPEVPAVADAPGGPAEPVEPVVPAAPTPPAGKKSVQVPVWLLAVLVVGVLTVGAFFVGRSTAPDSDSGPKTLADAVELTASGEMEVGDFDVRSLFQALGQNPNFDLGDLSDLILGGGRN